MRAQLTLKLTHLNQARDYGVNMAITVPKYSDSTGSGVNLPATKMDGMSPSMIRTMTNNGMIQGGKQISAYGAGIVTKNIKENKEEAHLWLINAETELKESLATSAEDLKGNTVPSDYLHNDSFKNGQNKNTYYNKNKSAYETELGRTIGPDKQQRYKPPSDYANQKWLERLPAIKANHNIRAMQYEGQVRSKALLDQLTTNLDSLNQQVFDDPSSLDGVLNTIDLLSTGKDDPSTAKKENTRGIHAQHLIGVGSAAAQKAVISAFTGLIRDNGFDAYAALKGKTVPGNSVGNSLLPHVTKMSAQQRLALENQARVKATTVQQLELTKFENVASTHVLSLSQGGPGVEELNDLDLAGGTTQLKQSHDNLWFGRHAELKKELFPNHASKAAAHWEKIQSAVRVGRVVGKTKIVSEEMDPATLNGLILRLNDAGKNGDTGSVLEIMEGHPLANDLVENMAELTLIEKAAVVNGVISFLSAELTKKIQDPALWLQSVDQFQYARQDTDEQKFELRNSKMAYLKKIGMPDANILTEGNAIAVAASANAITNVDAAKSLYTTLVKTYGDGDASHPQFQKVWAQLGNLKSGAIGHRWQVYAAFQHSQAGNALFDADNLDRKELLEVVKTLPNNEGAAEMGAAMKTMSPFILALTGGHPQRTDQASYMVKNIEKMIMADAIANSSSYQEAAKNVYATLTHRNIVVDTPKIKILLLPHHTKSDGHTINPEEITNNANRALDSSENLTKFLVGSNMTVDPMDGQPKTTPYFVPGTTMLPTGKGMMEQEQLFLNSISEFGRFISSNDGKSLILVYPSGGNSSMSADGLGTLVPVKMRNRDGNAGEVMSWPISEFGQPNYAQKWTQNNAFYFNFLGKSDDSE